jgi:hypothetical protein
MKTKQDLQLSLLSISWIIIFLSLFTKWMIIDNPALNRIHPLIKPDILPPAKIILGGLEGYVRLQIIAIPIWAIIILFLGSMGLGALNYAGTATVPSALLVPAYFTGLVLLILFIVMGYFHESATLSFGPYMALAGVILGGPIAFRDAIIKNETHPEIEPTNSIAPIESDKPVL